MSRTKWMSWLAGIGLSLTLTACGGSSGPTATPATSTTPPATVGATPSPATNTSATTVNSSPTPINVPNSAASATSTAPANQTAAVTSQSQSLDNLKVSRADELDLPTDVGDKILSPDGKLIAVNDTINLCIYSVADAKQNCVKPKAMLEPGSLRWSPDSRRLVYSDAFLTALLEPDIWVVDAASLKSTDLTDDGIEGVLKPNEAPRSSTIDLAPTWTADSKGLIFLRYDAIKPSTPPALFSVSADGGSPTRLGDLSPHPALYATSSLNLSANGKQLVFNILNIKTDNPDNGVWLSDLNGTGSRQLLKTALLGDSTEQLLKGQPALFVSFSADGRYLISEASPDLNTQFQLTWDNSSCRVVNLDGTESVVDGANAAHWAGWSPAGSAMIYDVRDGSPEIAGQKPSKAGLYVVDKPGGTGRLVQAGVFYGPYRHSHRSLVWASNNTTLALRHTMEGDKIVLLHLGQ